MYKIYKYKVKNLKYRQFNTTAMHQNIIHNLIYEIYTYDYENILMHQEVHCYLSLFSVKNFLKLLKE